MANVKKYTKQVFIEKAVEMIRKKGFSSLGMRSLADFANVSTQPLYCNFKDLNDLKDCVLTAINDIYLDFLQKEIDEGKYPAYKASGMGYVNFARQEPELFKALFMRSRKNEDGKREDEYFIETVKGVAERYNISFETAKKFHLIMWVVVHGIATQIATEYLTLSEEDVSDILSTTFKAFFAQTKKD